MNWNSKEFIWLDWTILIVGIIAVIWAVWRAVQKDKRMQQGESSEDISSVKENLGISLVRLSLPPTSVQNTL